MRTIILASALPLSLLAAAPAAAEPSDSSNAPAESIQFADLNLATADGMAQLNRRIARATETVCGSYASKDIVEQDAVTACRNKVRSSIEPQLAKARNADQTKLARK
jgi:UrcA family protein